MTFVISRDPRCRPRIVAATRPDGSVVARCGYRLVRNVRVLDDVREHRAVCRVCATAGPSVYIARDRHGSVLYVGRSLHVQRRFAQHSKTSNWWPLAAELQVERCATPLAAARREDALILSLRPRFNRVIRVTEQVAS